MGLPPSHRISRAPWYSLTDSSFIMPTTGLLPPLARVSTPIRLLWTSHVSATRYFYLAFGLLPFRSPLLRYSLFYFLFHRVLRWFSSPGSPPYTMCSYTDTLTFVKVRSRIRISVDQGLFATPHSFSQLITSFFGAWCLGILHTLFIA